MTSVERSRQMEATPSEAPWVLLSDAATLSADGVATASRVSSPSSEASGVSTTKGPPSSGGDAPWPREGRVSFRGLSARYRPELPLVLREVTIEVPPGRKASDAKLLSVRARWRGHVTAGRGPSHHRLRAPSASTPLAGRRRGSHG